MVKRGMVVLGLLLGVCFTTGWWSANFTRQGQATYSVLAHRLEGWWQGRLGYAEPDLDRGGTIEGTVYDTEGRPLSDATVVVSTDRGLAFTAITDREGRYEIAGVPAGRFVPAAVRHGYRAQMHTHRPWGIANPVRVRASRATGGVDFVLQRERAPELPERIVFGERVLVSDDYPAPTQAWRTEVTFERDGYPVVSYLYEPDSSPEKRLPAIVAAYPGLPLDWEPASIAFVAQGYAVLGIGPVSMRDTDVTADTEDLAAAMALLYAGKVSRRVDRGRIGALGGSFSSMALMRALHRAPYVRAVVLLGGLADVHLLRYDAYYHGYDGFAVQPIFEWAMWSLGRPDHLPRMYVENSAVLNVRGLPPLCLIHGTGDAVIPYNQSLALARVLEEAGQPYELHIYPDTGHYPGIYEPDPDTEAMYRQMVRFFARGLVSRSGQPGRR